MGLPESSQEHEEISGSTPPAHGRLHDGDVEETGETERSIRRGRKEIGPVYSVTQDVCRPKGYRRARRFSSF